MNEEILFKLTITPSDGMVLESQIKAIGSYKFDTVVKCEDGKLKIIISNIESYSLANVIREIHSNIKLSEDQDSIKIEYFNIEGKTEN